MDEHHTGTYLGLANGAQGCAHVNNDAPLELRHAEPQSPLTSSDAFTLDCVRKKSALSSSASSVFAEDLPYPFLARPKHEKCHPLDGQSSAFPNMLLEEEKSSVSLGQQIVSLATKARHMEKQCEVAVKEKRLLQKQFSETVEKKDAEIEKLKGVICQLRSQLHSVSVKNGLNVRQTWSEDLDAGERSGKNGNISAQERTLLQNISTCDTQSETKISPKCMGHSDLIDFGTTQGNDTICDKKTACFKLLQEERELKMQAMQTLDIENQRNKILEYKLKSMEKLLKELQSSSSNGSYKDGHSSQDKIVEDLLTEISVLQEQMVVVVEDFEKERSDKAKVVTSRNKLKENFDSLSQRVRMFKQQLVIANGRMADYIAQNNALNFQVEELRSNLRAKDSQIAELSGRFFCKADPPQLPPNVYVPPGEPAKFYNRNYIGTPSWVHWSCSICAYLNPLQRSVCERCGNINRKNQNLPRSVNGYDGQSVNGYDGHSGRTCRLVSRGLSTDETWSNPEENTVARSPTSQTHQSL